jgi:protocatechuate 3,4-dioxygenase beta subunit
MDNDDRPIGRLLTRREVLGLMGGATVALIIGCTGDDDGAEPTTSAASPTSGAATSAATSAPTSGATAVPSCVVRPEQTEGPYFVDEQLQRSDIRTEPSDGATKEGAELHLTFNVSQIANGACTPLEGAQVDVWHCDALGVYSGVSGGGSDTTGQSFLRGYQITDGNGVAKFVTIVPGWYQGRTVHIHFKIRYPANADSAWEFTSQLYFDPELTRQLLTGRAPYSSKGEQDTSNARDAIYGNGGDQMLLALTGDTGGRYTATFDIALDLSDAAAGQPDGFGGAGAPP